MEKEDRYFKQKLFESDRKISKSGRTGFISVPPRFIGKRAKVTIYSEGFLCVGCSELISKSQEGKIKNYCISCTQEKIAKDKKICVSCKRKLNPKELEEAKINWGRCDNCQLKMDKEIDEMNKNGTREMVF